MENMCAYFIVVLLFSTTCKFQAASQTTEMSPTTLPIKLTTTTSPAPLDKSSTTSPTTTSTTSPTTTSTTSRTTSLNSTDLKDMDARINLKLQIILETSRTGYFVGNVEFDQQTAFLRHTASLDINSLQLKIAIYHRFVSYNALRLQLEAEISRRIAVIDSYFYEDQLSWRCREFYRNQKRELTNVLNGFNSLKSYALRLYDGECPRQGSDGGWESAEDLEGCCSWNDFFPFNILK